MRTYSTANHRMKKTNMICPLCDSNLYLTKLSKKLFCKICYEFKGGINENKRSV